MVAITISLLNIIATKNTVIKEKGFRNCWHYNAKWGKKKFTEWFQLYTQLFLHVFLGKIVIWVQVFNLPSAPEYIRGFCKKKNKRNIVFMFEARLVSSICQKFYAVVLVWADSVVLEDVWKLDSSFPSRPPLSPPRRVRASNRQKLYLEWRRVYLTMLYPAKLPFTCEEDRKIFPSSKGMDRIQLLFLPM